MKNLKDISLKEQIFLFNEGKITINDFYEEELEVPEEIQLYLVKKSEHNISVIKNPSEKVQKYVMSKNPDCFPYIINPSVEAIKIYNNYKKTNHNKNTSFKWFKDVKNILNNMFNSPEKLTKRK